MKINGECKYLWRAVDQEGQVLDILVQPKRDKAAAERFFKKVLRGMAQAPRKVVTDRLASYSPVLRSCPMQPILGLKEQTIEQRTQISQPVSESVG